MALLHILHTVFLRADVFANELGGARNATIATVEWSLFQEVISGNMYRTYAGSRALPTQTSATKETIGAARRAVTQSMCLHQLDVRETEFLESSGDASMHLCTYYVK